jgi:hypothetical protein
MGKYQPLGDFLRQQHSEMVPMKLEEIERLLGSALPKSSQHHRAWWSNNPDNNVMTKVWLEAGFQTEQVDIEKRRLVFRRTRRDKESETAPPASRPSTGTGLPGEAPRHPLFGALQGLVRVMPGTDLTKPADPNWGGE